MSGGGAQRPRRETSSPLAEQQDPQPAGCQQDLADLVTDNVMYLKLSKRGNTYTGAISVDGETYYDLGASASGNYSDPKIGLLASVMALWTATI